MKNLMLLLLIAFVFSFAQCKKSNPDSNGLPAATQDGKNTLGFLLNGQPWKPQGTVLTGNLSIDFDINFNQGIFNIVAYDFTSPNPEQLTIGVRDSLIFMSAPFSLNLNRNSLYVISFTKNCEYFSTLSDVESSGSLTVSKLDKINHIISGTFNAVLSKVGCDTVRITEGRFDMKY